MQHPSVCPFCGAQAVFSEKDYANRKRFTCPSCKEFEISKFAESIAISASKEWRQSHSEVSQKAPDGYFYVLTRPTQETPNASTGLVGRYVKREQ